MTESYQHLLSTGWVEFHGVTIKTAVSIRALLRRKARMDRIKIRTYWHPLCEDPERGYVFAWLPNLRANDNTIA